MMILYTINNVYPDKNFNFTIIATDIGLANKFHEHELIDLTNLNEAFINVLADQGHDHEKLDSIVVNSVPVMGAIKITPEKNLTLSVTGDVCKFSYNPVKSGIIKGFKNSNPNRQNISMKFFTGEKYFNDNDSEFIVFMEDTIWLLI